MLVSFLQFFSKSNSLFEMHLHQTTNLGVRGSNPFGRAKTKIDSNTYLESNLFLYRVQIRRHDIGLLDDFGALRSLPPKHHVHRH